jgi:uncharacterized membrane protein
MEDRHLFNRLNSVHKLLISIAVAVTLYFVVPFKVSSALPHIIFCWDIFSFSLLVLIWITFYTTPHRRIRKQAQRQDSTRGVIFILVLVCTSISMLAVVLIIVTRTASDSSRSVLLPEAIACMFLSWFLLHTIFAIRYAHMYYADHKIKKDTYIGGLNFPEESHPDFVDFAYFAFTIGMTFQVSDTEISSRSIRRLALWHGLISFGYNATIIALGVNIVAGLAQKP